MLNEKGFENKEGVWISRRRVISRAVSIYLSKEDASRNSNASFYFFRKAFFDAGHRTVITERSLAYLVPHTCFDLDEPIDFEFLSYLLANDKLGFQL